MTLLIPEWSLDDFEDQEWHISTLRKRCAKFQVSICTERRDSCCVSRSSSKESCMTFLIPNWSLDDFDHQEWHISTLKRLCAKYQVSRCPGREPSSCVSLASSKESRMTFLIPEWSLDNFEWQEWHIYFKRLECPCVCLWVCVAVLKIIWEYRVAKIGPKGQSRASQVKNAI